MLTFFRHPLPLVVVFTALFFSCTEESKMVISEGPIKVEIKKEGDRYVILRAGEPYKLEGAGLEYGDMEALAKHGGNSFRTWRTDNGVQSGQEILDRAMKNGLTVSLCLDVQRERHGFDYDDEMAVEAQFQKMKEEVIKYKDHPALLFWVIGNEMNHHASNVKVYDALNDISKMIHEIDPNHPTTTTVAGINKELVNIIKERASDIDVLSIQLYGDLVNLPKYIQDCDWTKPYMVTEWGAIGHWEVGKTEWGAPIENNSSVKADYYLKGYQTAIEPYDDQCIGSYVFLWGQKQERTPTWYGMFLQEGFETESIDVMHYIWNEEWPQNRSPRIQSFRLDEKVASDNIYLESEKSYSAIASIVDFENDSLTYRWEIKPESKETTEGGDHEDEIASLDGLTNQGANQNLDFTSPSYPGAYRLFVYAYDGNGHAAHANIPFFVKN
ncbi:MAG: hypothetical protein JXR07_01030 [Reichenbachiella sp.]